MAAGARFPQPKAALREAITLTLEEHETVLGKMRDLLALSQLILESADDGVVITVPCHAAPCGRRLAASA